MTKADDLFQEIVTLATGQRLNLARVETGGHGSAVAMLELRRVANEIRLKAEHYRALTSPSLDPADAEKVDAEHMRRWANRKGISGQG